MNGNIKKGLYGKTLSETAKSQILHRGHKIDEVATVRSVGEVISEYCFTARTGTVAALVAQYLHEMSDTQMNAFTRWVVKEHNDTAAVMGADWQAIRKANKGRWD